MHLLIRLHNAQCGECPCTDSRQDFTISKVDILQHQRNIQVSGASQLAVGNWREREGGREGEREGGREGEQERKIERQSVCVHACVCVCVCVCV